MRDDRLTERQWWRKAKRHEKWLAAMAEELEAIGIVIERPPDAQALRRSAARAQAIARRIAQLQRVMRRHQERARCMLADIPAGNPLMLTH